MSNNVRDFYINKVTPGYFSTSRIEILSLLPKNIDRVLEVGCGSGETIRFLKEQTSCQWACGIDICDNRSSGAAGYIDCFIEGNIESMKLNIAPKSLDLVLCLDVLEHLTDPWTILSNLKDLLKPDGVIIASIPNIQNLRVILPLIFLGKWEYKDSGILDRTHLRFFTKSSAISLLSANNFKVTYIKKIYDTKPIVRFANFVTFYLFSKFLIIRYIISVVKN
jgi:2-polyprenyl-3-methyl-5-hydroxy-6-metoxy-1,4-benzoquinol methylase